MRRGKAMTNRRTIDLSDATSGRSRVLVGRRRGQAIRESKNIEQIDSDEHDYLIMPPEGVRTITVSFWLGLFGESITALGEKRFREKYQIHDKLHKDRFNSAIQDALVGLDDQALQ